MCTRAKCLLMALTPSIYCSLLSSLSSKTQWDNLLHYMLGHVTLRRNRKLTSILTSVTDNSQNYKTPLNRKKKLQSSQFKSFCGTEIRTKIVINKTHDHWNNTASTLHWDRSVKQQNMKTNSLEFDKLFLNKMKCRRLLQWGEFLQLWRQSRQKQNQ